MLGETDKLLYHRVVLGSSAISHDPQFVVKKNWWYDNLKCDLAYFFTSSVSIISVSLSSISHPFHTPDKCQTPKN
jgi:hypothetical protein